MPFLQDEQELEEDAKAVLGAADDKNCTYSQGKTAFSFRAYVNEYFESGTEVTFFSRGHDFEGVYPWKGLL